MATDQHQAKPATVDEFLAADPEEQRAALEQLRQTIRAAAPMATEVISYAIPAFRHHGALVSYAAAKNHCAFYVMSGSLLEGYAEELKGYETGKGSIRFTPHKPLPAELVTKLVKARVAENEKLRKK